MLASFENVQDAKPLALLYYCETLTKASKALKGYELDQQDDSYS